MMTKNQYYKGIQAGNHQIIKIITLLELKTYHTMNCKEAKNISIIHYLSSIGLKPEKDTDNESWYLSPFRTESTASFKVDHMKNLYYDFGEGIGGTIIDLVMKIRNCNVAEALNELSKESFSFQEQTTIPQINIEPKYLIKAIRPLSSPALLEYLKERKIDLAIAKQFCCQIHYQFSSDKTYYGIGFKNDLNGYEIRNRYFKGCLGRKFITTISQESKTLSLFESWSDFLSYLTLKKEKPVEDYMILNSTSLVRKCFEDIKKYERVKTFLDNDEAGEKTTLLLRKNMICDFKDYRKYFEGFKDLNDFLVNRKKLN
ncbi:toprim domain-containing protein [Nonlabens sp. Asnod2-A12]|uniref:toprim domain-containing protein n=1 Tax=Nonlabens sp. Asnod2-A12 TaxID=3160578 RepID=UPI003864B540